MSAKNPGVGRRTVRGAQISIFTRKKGRGKRKDPTNQEVGKGTEIC